MKKEEVRKMEESRFYVGLLFNLCRPSEDKRPRLNLEAMPSRFDALRLAS